MIELLGTIAILGVLSFIAVAAVSKYVGTSRSKSFVMMSQSAYQATENCILHNQLDQCRIGNTINIKDDLFDKGYLDSLKNPVGSKPRCTGTVQILDTGYVDSGITSYKFIVDLNCPGYRHSTIEWPNTKSLKELMEM